MTDSITCLCKNFKYPAFRNHILGCFWRDYILTWRAFPFVQKCAWQCINLRLCSLVEAFWNEKRIYAFCNYAGSNSNKFNVVPSYHSIIANKHASCQSFRLYIKPFCFIYPWTLSTQHPSAEMVVAVGVSRLSCMTYTCRLCRFRVDTQWWIYKQDHLL
jgi:hypothetical protein